MPFSAEFEYSRAFRAKMIRANDPTPVVSLIHRIGNIKVWHTPSGNYRNRWIVTRDDHSIGAGMSAEEALAEARFRIPKSQRVEGEIITYRGWNLLGDLLVPVSMGPHAQNRWEGPVMRSDQSPIGNFDSGLYSVKIPYAKQIISQYRPAVHGFTAIPPGAHAVEHERGYRSSMLVVRLLRTALPVSDKFLALLEERYQCQVLRTTGEVDW